MPTGDMDADLAVIRANYAGALGRHTERMGEIRFRETEVEADAPKAPLS